MNAREKFGLAALLIVALSGCVLVDSWFMEDGSIDLDGEGPQAPVPSFEIAAKARPIDVELDSPPSLPLRTEGCAEDVDAPLAPEAERGTSRPRPVDPAGWLGRRHFRSPT